MAARRGLHGLVVDDLGRRIVHGEIEPGALLVSDEIGEAHGASRTVVRETMRVLESKGLITARPNVGTQVCDPARWHGLDLDVLRWRLTGPDAATARHELLEVRHALEPMIARLAAERATSSDRDALLVAVARMKAASAMNDMGEFTAADVDFHDQLFTAAGNSMLDDLSALVSAALGDRVGVVADHGISPYAIELHETLAAAIAAGDAELATHVMSDILREQE